MSIGETGRKGLELGTNQIRHPYVTRSLQFTSVLLDVFWYCVCIALSGNHFAS